MSDRASAFLNSSQNTQLRKEISENTHEGSDASADCFFVRAVFEHLNPVDIEECDVLDVLASVKGSEWLDVHYCSR